MSIRYFVAGPHIATNEAINAVRFDTYDLAVAEAMKAKVTPLDAQTKHIYRETVEAVAVVTIVCERSVQKIGGEPA